MKGFLVFLTNEHSNTCFRVGGSHHALHTVIMSTDDMQKSRTCTQNMKYVSNASTESQSDLLDDDKLLAAKTAPDSFFIGPDSVRVFQHIVMSVLEGQVLHCVLTGWQILVALT